MTLQRRLEVITPLPALRPLDKSLNALSGGHGCSLAGTLSCPDVYGLPDCNRLWQNYGPRSRRLTCSTRDFTTAPKYKKGCSGNPHEVQF
jgi:hypothetical protein